MIISDQKTEKTSVRSKSPGENTHFRNMYGEKCKCGKKQAGVASTVNTVNVYMYIKKV